MAKISGSDVRPGMVIEFDGSLWAAVKTGAVKPGNKMYVTGYQGMGIKISDPEAVAIAAFLSSLK